MVRRSPDLLTGLGTVAVTGAAGNIDSVVREALRRDATHLILLDSMPLRPEAENEVVHPST